MRRLYHQTLHCQIPAQSPLQVKSSTLGFHLGVRCEEVSTSRWWLDPNLVTRKPSARFSSSLLAESCLSLTPRASASCLSTSAALWEVAVTFTNGQKLRCGLWSWEPLTFMMQQTTWLTRYPNQSARFSGQVRMEAP